MMSSSSSPNAFSFHLSASRNSGNRSFGTSPGFWLNLQKAYELEVTERAEGERIRAEVAPRVAA